jgi:FkbM family methyltransferase
LITSDLIYDVGMHNGDDTAFYLHQGFRVLAVEADASLVERAATRFATELRSRQLTILNVGIGEETGTSVFWIRDDCSIWNSFDRRIAARNGGQPRSVTVPTRRFREILDEWGVPIFLKVDIEGYDLLCVKDLVGRPLPQFISVESECVGDADDLDESMFLAMLNALHEVGYRRFKLICQADLSSATMSGLVVLGRRIVHSAACGRLRVRGIARFAQALTPEMRISSRHQYKFLYGSSGPWGEGTHGRWSNFDQAKRLYLKTRRRHFEGTGVAKYSFWYDWHATY